MKSHVLFCGLLGLAGACLVGCADRDQLAEHAFLNNDATFDAETGMLNRLYDYYPEQQVYHSHTQDRYFWYDEEAKQWADGHELPASFVLNERDRTFVALPTSHPWTLHDDVVATHPSTGHLREELAAVIASVPTDE